MSSVARNSLMRAGSAYLRSAMHQPVQWFEWGAEAFARAQGEDKPILLDIGAVWCHWCHVMDRESYEDAATAQVVNDHFIAIKVDRDERPDIDARYQAAVAAISGQGGWPLTAFLTPEGKPYFGGTYFPPVDGHGRPSLRRVLLTMAGAYLERRGEVEESAASVMAAIEQNESFAGGGERLSEELVTRIVSHALKQFDPRNGGFAAQPKFPHPAALDLLLDQSSRVGEENAQAAKTAAEVTLRKMASGGIYDHLAGGFHRYSVDERWVVPHFEKMSYDNSELLRNYVHAYQGVADPEYARVARECMTWIDTWLSDRERGGFYTSQAADGSLDNDGDYFTWTRSEAAAVLTHDELAIVSIYFDIGELGDMRHNVEKNTLHIEQPLAAAARQVNKTPERAAALIASAKAKLYAARELRPMPFIDKTMYVNWNAMMISAYLEAGRVLGAPQAVAFALKTLDRLLDAVWDGEAKLEHVISYGDGARAAQAIDGVLDDYVCTGHAALDAWQATGEYRWFDIALRLAEAAIAKFHDQDKGGFFDTEALAAGAVRLGALNARRKPLQDAPTPAGNSVAAALLLRLAELTGRHDLRARAKATLECFASVVEHFGLYAASYGLALERYLLPPVQVVVVGPDAVADALEAAALKSFAINRSVARLRSISRLPPSLAETIPHLPAQETSYAIVCSGFACQPPVIGEEELRELLARQE